MCSDFDLESSIEEFCFEEGREGEKAAKARSFIASLDEYLSAAGTSVPFATEEDVWGWVEDSERAPKTIQGALYLLGRYYDYLMERGIAVSNPAKAVKIRCPENLYEQPYTKAELHRIAAAAAELYKGSPLEGKRRSYALFCLYTRCFVSWSEMGRLTLADYKPDGISPAIVVDGPKSAVVPLDMETMGAIEGYLELAARKSLADPLFTKVDRKTGTPVAMSRHDISRIMKPVYKLAGVEGRLGALRAACIREVVESGATVEEALKLSRDKDLAKWIRRLYLSNQESLVETQGRLAAALESRRPAAQGTVTREELWMAYLAEPEFEFVDITLFDSGEVEFGNYR